MAALRAGDDAEALALGQVRRLRQTVRMPGRSTATGFSVKTCLPASTAALRCIGRKPGGVARMT